MTDKTDRERAEAKARELIVREIGVPLDETASAITDALLYARREGWEAGREAAAKVAEHGCLVPPDGGSPTNAEREMCEAIAVAIRAILDEQLQDAMNDGRALQPEEP
jgi:hypothetical protein